MSTVWKLTIDTCRCDSPGVDLTLVGPLEHRSDKDAQAVVPRWIHNPEDLLVDQTEYELVEVPLTSVSLVTAKTIKVKRRSVLTMTV